ncbi:uncharacterized protein LOC144121522 isoform X6 [Amblyomma americanum]
MQARCCSPHPPVQHGFLDAMKAPKRHLIATDGYYLSAGKGIQELAEVFVRGLAKFYGVDILAPFSGAPARYIIHWCHHCGSKGHRHGDCFYKDGAAADLQLPLQVLLGRSSCNIGHLRQGKQLRLADVASASTFANTPLGMSASSPYRDAGLHNHSYKDHYSMCQFLRICLGSGGCRLLSLESPVSHC